MKNCIVIPTYNESENIGKLLELIFALRIEDFHVLIVDDNSPDRTGKIVEELKKKYPNLHVLHRTKKEGLGPAYIAGFQWAKNFGAKKILQMDADFSHDPKHIPDFLRASENYDVVLGSRYIHGGGIKNWNFFRKIISRFGNFYARIILGLPFHDVTGGFKCYRAIVFDSFDFRNISSLGYNFQIETTYRAYNHGFRIQEIPILFSERKDGKSKFNGPIIFEAFWRVLLLRFNKK